MEKQVDHAWNLINERLNQWFEIAVKGLPNFIAALLIITFFTLLAKWIHTLMLSVMRRSLNNKALSNLFATCAQFVVVTVGFFIALGVLNLDKTVTSLLAGAGVVGLALGFAFQDIASNFISGVLIAFREPYKLGDIVEIEGYTGEVKSIDLRTTLIETFQGIEIYIPNKLIYTNPLQNISGTPRRRLDIEVGVSYAEDLRKVESIIKESLDSLKDRIADKVIEVFFKEFGGSSINCDVRVWVHYPNQKNYLAVRHEAIIRIKEAFDSNDITIPFPIRTLDFGIKGGEKLNQPLMVAAETYHEKFPPS